eukprot:SAG25_NODE_14103_length_259_cov_0.637500_2_plen_43_part_01
MRPKCARETAASNPGSGAPPIGNRGALVIGLYNALMMRRARPL